MKKWKASTGTPRIVMVEVEKETDASVWVQGQRRAKRADYESYFDTWEDAKGHLLAYFGRECDVARGRLERANSTFGNVKGMKKPEGE